MANADKGARFLDGRAASRMQRMSGARAMGTTSRPKLPAYGRAVMELRRNGLIPFGWLSVVREWPKAIPPDSIGWHVVIPSADDPAKYDLSLCSGLPVLAVMRSYDNSNAVLVSLIEAAKPAICCAICDGEFAGWIPG
jgi:hypothetical protein